MSYDWTTTAGGRTISMCQEMKGDETSGYLLVGGSRYNQAFTVQMKLMDLSLSLACPIFPFTMKLIPLHGPFSFLLHSLQSFLFVLSFFLLVHYVDHLYCHVTRGLCSITLIFSFVLFLLLLGPHWYSSHYMDGHALHLNCLQQCFSTRLTWLPTPRKFIIPKKLVRFKMKGLEISFHFDWSMNLHGVRWVSIKARHFKRAGF